MRCDATGLELTAYGEKLAVRLHYAVACRHGCRTHALAFNEATREIYSSGEIYTQIYNSEPVSVLGRYG
jgi:hypothetical protein